MSLAAIAKRLSLKSPSVYTWSRGILPSAVAAKFDSPLSPSPTSERVCRVVGAMASSTDAATEKMAALDVGGKSKAKKGLQEVWFVCVHLNIRGGILYIHVPPQMDPPPEFLAPRVEMFERLKKEYDDWVAGKGLNCVCTSSERSRQLLRLHSSSGHAHQSDAARWEGR